MSKKLFVAVMSLMLMFVLAGCGGDTAEQASDEATTEATEAHAEHPTGDDKTAEHPAAEHPTDEHPAAEHPTGDAADSTKTDHPK